MKRKGTKLEFEIDPVVLRSIDFKRIMEVFDEIEETHEVTIETNEHEFESVYDLLCNSDVVNLPIIIYCRGQHGLPHIQLYIHWSGPIISLSGGNAVFEVATRRVAKILESRVVSSKKVSELVFDNQLPQIIDSHAALVSFPTITTPMPIIDVTPKVVEKGLRSWIRRNFDNMISKVIAGVILFFITVFLGWILRGCTG